MRSIPTTNLERRVLGPFGLEVSAIGLGCMGFSWGYGARPQESKAIAVIHAALDSGITFFDTAELYGPYVNEELLARALKGCRERATIATKVGYKFEDGKIAGLDSRPASVRKAVEGCLRRLGSDYIDLLYQHRVDPGVAIEETVGEMARMVAEGKVRHIGLCEANAETIKRAHATHPLTALQSEYSLWERSIETSVIATLQQLNIGLVAFCPLGRGLFGGEFDSSANLADTDIRRTDPRFKSSNISQNMLLVQTLKRVANRKCCTPAQIALAWIFHKLPNVVPIPGTTSGTHLSENAAAVRISLHAKDLQELDALAARRVGERAFRNAQ